MHDINKIISDMTIEQKIGQMFMANICGGESLDVAKRDFEQLHIGNLQFSGVFERFVRGGDYMPCGVCENRPLEETAQFLWSIKQAALDIMGLPVIIGGDQEGSIESSAFRRGNITIMPAQMGLGAGDSFENTYRAASITACEVKLLGLDMLYGPSLDVNTNPLNPEIGSRSFGESPQLVVSHGEQVIKAFKEHNVISNAKHFPGRGHGCANAHHSLESIDLDMERLNAVELLPFRRAIAAGVDSIMMSHTVFPAIDSSGLPSSLSPSVIGFLREELGFDGMIIPDTMTMFAISKNFDVPRACAMCLEAGADMIFMKVRELYKPVIEAIKDSIKAGRLSEERINRSLNRILSLKLKRGLFDNKRHSHDELAKVGCAEHAGDMKKIALHGVTVLKDEGLLPLQPKDDEPIFMVLPRDMNVVLANDRNLSHDLLVRSVAKFHSNCYYTVVDEKPTIYQNYESVGLAKNAGLIIFGIYSAGMSDEQFALLSSLAELGKPIIAVITGSPYIAAKIADKVQTIICTFGIAPCTFDAFAEILFGKARATAKLPVTINGL